MTDQTMMPVGQPLSQQQQAETIKEMHDLLIYIEMNDAMLNNLKHEQGSAVPPKPVRQMVKPSSSYCHGFECSSLRYSPMLI